MNIISKYARSKKFTSVCYIITLGCCVMIIIQQHSVKVQQADVKPLNQKKKHFKNPLFASSLF